MKKYNLLAAALISFICTGCTTLKQSTWHEIGPQACDVVARYRPGELSIRTWNKPRITANLKIPDNWVINKEPGFIWNISAYNPEATLFVSLKGITLTDNTIEKDSYQSYLRAIRNKIDPAIQMGKWRNFSTTVRGDELVPRRYYSSYWKSRLAYIVERYPLQLTAEFYAKPGDDTALLKQRKQILEIIGSLSFPTDGKAFHAGMPLHPLPPRSSPAFTGYFSE